MQRFSLPSSLGFCIEKGMLCSMKMFNLLTRKDVRKILKRKDSDAGERGNFFFLAFFVYFLSGFFDFFLQFLRWDLV